MTQSATAATRRARRPPRSAPLAGVLFAALFGASVVLIRLAIPADPAAAPAGGA